MDLQADVLCTGLALSIVGAAVFVYGRRQSRFPHLAVGSALCIFPYFVPSVPIMLGIAAALLVGLAVAVRLGL